MGASHQEQSSHQPAEVAAAGGREHSSGIGSTALSTCQVGRRREGGVDHRPLDPVKWIVKVLLAVCRSAPEIEQTITAGSPRLIACAFHVRLRAVRSGTFYFLLSRISRQASRAYSSSGESLPVHPAERASPRLDRLREQPVGLAAARRPRKQPLHEPAALGRAVDRVSDQPPIWRPDRV